MNQETPKYSLSNIMNSFSSIHSADSSCFNSLINKVNELCEQPSSSPNQVLPNIQYQYNEEEFCVNGSDITSVPGLSNWPTPSFTTSLLGVKEDKNLHLGEQIFLQRKEKLIISGFQTPRGDNVLNTTRNNILNNKIESTPNITPPRNISRSPLLEDLESLEDSSHFEESKKNLGGWESPIKPQNPKPNPRYSYACTSRRSNNIMNIMRGEKENELGRGIYPHMYNLKQNRLKRQALKMLTLGDERECKHISPFVVPRDTMGNRINIINSCSSKKRGREVLLDVDAENQLVYRQKRPKYEDLGESVGDGSSMRHSDIL